MWKIREEEVLKVLFSLLHSLTVFFFSSLSAVCLIYSSCMADGLSSVLEGPALVVFAFFFEPLDSLGNGLGITSGVSVYEIQEFPLK